MSKTNDVYGHQNSIFSIKFSPDGTQILSSSYDGTAKVWEVESGRLIYEFYRSSECVSDSAWSPDGQTIAIAYEPPAPTYSAQELERYQAYFESRDRSHFNSLNEQASPSGKIIFYDSDSMLEGQRLCLHATGITFAPDSKTIATISLEGVFLVEIASGQRLAEFLNERTGLAELFFSQDGKLLIGIGLFGVWVFDAATARLRKVVTDDRLFSELDEREAGLNAIEYELDRTEDPGSEIAVSEWPGYLKAFWKSKLSDGLPSQVGDAVDWPQIVFSNDGKTAVVASGSDWRLSMHVGRGVVIVPAGSQSDERFLGSPDNSWIRTIAYSPDGSRVAFAGDDQKIFVTSPECPKKVFAIGVPPPAVTALELNENGNALAVGFHDGTLALVDTSTPKFVKSQKLSSAIRCLEFSAETNSWVAVGDGMIHVLATGSLEMRFDIECPAGRFAGGTLSRDGKFFFLIRQGGSRSPLGCDMFDRTHLDIWSLEEGRLLESSVLPPTTRLTSVTRSPDRTKLAFATWDRVWILDLLTRAEPDCIFHRPKSETHSLTFLPDGSHLLLANSGYAMAVIQLSGVAESEESSPRITGRLLATRDGQTAIVVSPCGKWLFRATAYHDLIEQFDFRTRKLKKFLIGHRNCVRRLVIGKHDQTLISGAGDGVIKFWDLETGFETGSLQIQSLQSPERRSERSEPELPCD